MNNFYIKKLSKNLIFPKNIRKNSHKLGERAKSGQKLAPQVQPTLRPHPADLHHPLFYKNIPLTKNHGQCPRAKRYASASRGPVIQQLRTISGSSAGSIKLSTYFFPPAASRSFILIYHLGTSLLMSSGSLCSSTLVKLK